MSTSKRFGRLSASWQQRSEDYAGKRRKRQKAAASASQWSMFQSWQQRRKAR